MEDYGRLYKNIDMKTPNIAHFIAGMSQNEQFKFVYYMSVVSCIKVNNPDKIHFFFSYEPEGHWWDELKKLDIEFHQVPLPTHQGTKEIIHPQHRADKLRMEILREYGGVYLDFDTICVKPYHHLLQHEYAMGQESSTSLCNAIIFSEPNAEFLDLWEKDYVDAFVPNGWAEACVVLPMTVAKNHPDKITILPGEMFYRPMWYETQKIFEDDCPVVPEDLYILHLWNKISEPYINQINGFEWVEKNAHTLYGKLLLKIKEI